MANDTGKPALTPKPPNDLRKSVFGGLVGDQGAVMRNFRAKVFKIGDRVKARNDDQDQWLMGTVVQVGPVKIRPDGQEQVVGPGKDGYWKFIEKLQSAATGLEKIHNFKDKCKRCPIEAVWAACDVFWQFDVHHTGAITRSEYMARLGGDPSATRLRILRRSRLETRFRKSARPVHLEEFLQLCWPNAEEDDMALMSRWCQLREAKSVLLESNFRGVESELRRVFDLLDGFGQGSVCAIALVRGQIVTALELEQLTQKKNFKEIFLDLETFRNQFWQYLKNEYVTKEALLRMKKEEEATMAVKFSPL